MKKTFILTLSVLFILNAYNQTTYDWFDTAPDGNWRQGAAGARWTGGLWDEPPSTNILRFNNNHELSMTNNVSNYNVNQIVFGSSNTSSRTIGGNDLGFFDFGGNDPKIENQSTGAHTLTLNITGDPNDPLEINPVSGDLTLEGTVDNNGSDLYIYGDNSNTLTISGIVSGSGGFLLQQNSTVILSANNTYNGTTSVNAGTLKLQGDLASSTITVASGATLQIDGTLSVNSIVNNGTVELLTGSDLTINGDFTDNGTFTHNDRPVTFGGSALQTIGGSATTVFYTVTIDNSAGVITASGKDVQFGPDPYQNVDVLTIASGSVFDFESTTTGHVIRGNLVIHGNKTIRNDADIEVKNKLFVKTGGSLTLAAGGMLKVDGTSALEGTGTFTIQSTSSATGSFIPVGTCTGSVTVERYIADWTDATHGWHLLSSPVASQAIRPNFVPDPPTANEDFYMFDETASSENWINSKSAPGTWNSGFDANFVVGKGYLVAYGASSAVSHNFEGTLNIANVSISGLTNTPASPHTGYNLVGNPYSSALTWDIGNWTSTNINSTAKVWVESSASYSDVTDGSGVIPAMQGFLVYVSDEAGGSFTIDANDRVHSDQNWYKSVDVNHIKLTVYDTEGNTAQETNVRFNSNSTESFDNQYDSYFVEGYAPKLYSITDDGNLSTNTIPEVTYQTIIPLGFVKNNSSAYYIKAEGFDNLEPQETVYLTDLKTNYTQILNDNPIYEFASYEGDMENRFVMHFGALDIDEVDNSLDMKIFASNNTIEIRSGTAIEGNVQVYNLAGQLLISGQLIIV